MPVSLAFSQAKGDTWIASLSAQMPRKWYDRQAMAVFLVAASSAIDLVALPCKALILETLDL